LLDEHTHAPVRTQVERDTGSGLDTEPRYQKFSDLQKWSYFDYDLRELVDNTTKVTEDANYYINGLLQQYEVTTPHTIAYAGMMRVELDGAIQQWFFRFGQRGCTTTISRNNEQLNNTPPLSYRRMMAKLQNKLRNEEGKKTLRNHRKGFTWGDPI
jgi:hypothetical protein